MSNTGINETINELLQASADGLRGSGSDIQIVGLGTRSTMDLDTTIKGFTLTHDAIQSIFHEICAIEIEDDMQVEIAGVSDIREGTIIRASGTFPFDGLRGIPAAVMAATYLRGFLCFYFEKSCRTTIHFGQLNKRYEE